MERVVQRVEFKGISPLPVLRRVAAYARVSSGKDAMLHSLAAQVSYYSELIQNNPDWLYCGVYSDEAKTGTKEMREGFQSMLNACREGKIDLVITKSISRFARNTVDTLTIVRELKALGVDVFFEEQNIHTCGPDGELLLTILAAYAQAESLSASENQKWRVRKAFEEGELYNLRFMFGYRVTPDGLEIEPAEAEVVKELFTRVADGESLSSIAENLNQRGVPRPLGGRWNTMRIHEIVTNEKYCGNALLWKSFRENHLTKKKTKNQGEMPMFYVENSHEAIITPELYNAALERIRILERAAAERPKPKASVFSGLIHCGSCGNKFKRITNHGRPAYQCTTFLKEGKNRCPAKMIPEKTLLTEAAAVLDVNNLDADTVHNGFLRIDVPKANHLVFTLRNGQQIERIWKDRSRSESWTDEMKEEARSRAKCQQQGK